jgi:hypothetical protein
MVWHTDCGIRGALHQSLYFNLLILNCLFILSKMEAVACGRNGGSLSKSLPVHSFETSCAEISRTLGATRMRRFSRYDGESPCSRRIQT